MCNNSKLVQTWLKSHGLFYRKWQRLLIWDVDKWINDNLLRFEKGKPGETSKELKNEITKVYIFIKKILETNSYDGIVQKQ